MMPANMARTRPAEPRDVRFTIAGVLAVGLAAGILSFFALSDLAYQAGITGRLVVGPARFYAAWLFPIAVDAFLVISTLTWLLRWGPADAVRFARWSTLAGITTTVVGNAYHGYLAGAGAVPPWLAAVVVSAVPAVALGALCHLGALLGRPPVDELPANEPTADELVEVEAEVGVPVSTTSTTSFLYRLRDADGVLLYVGITGHYRLRLMRHRADKPWWSEVASVELTAYRRRSQALAVEQYVIAHEQPRYNAHPGALVDSATPTADRADPDQSDAAGDGLDNREVPAGATDDDLIADLREWTALAGGPVGRDRIVKAYGVGTTRAMRLRSIVEQTGGATGTTTLTPAQVFELSPRAAGDVMVGGERP